MNAFACYKQKCKLAPFNLSHPVVLPSAMKRLPTMRAPMLLVAMLILVLILAIVDEVFHCPCP